MGILYATPARGKEIFSFEYDPAWLKSGNAQNLDPALALFTGPQYSSAGKTNFGIFLDSAPDRWGRLLMERREAQIARFERRPQQTLYESNYLLGVFDGHRMGGLRFRLDGDGPFLDDNQQFASPPWTSLRELEYASLQIERDDAEEDPNYNTWLQLLVAPGSSIGGARPKASVLDEHGQLWIAKFPSRMDTYDLGAWEHLVHQLGQDAGILAAEAIVRTFNTQNHTFLTKRFDRAVNGRRLHFASAMTLLGRTDGDDESVGASYLEMAELLIRDGAHTNRDLEQLWRRIVFSICVSNADDHLRNHGFLLEPAGWTLSPAYDINPVPYANGLALNISDVDNAQDLQLAREVAPYFRIKPPLANSIITDIVQAVKQWRSVASLLGISTREQERMNRAFRIADAE
jgi:serine/threonine-protein kinase HipA